MPTAKNRYWEILRASSIIGGAKGLNYIIGLARMKALALILGPSGVGLIGLYQSTTAMTGTISDLGIRSSGVREIANANTIDNPKSLAETTLTLRRACWVTGLLGWLLTAGLAYPLSQLTFGSADYAVNIAILGIVLLFGALRGGQTALIQGIRKIGDLAKFQVLSALAGTVLSIAIYLWMGEDGIVPALILNAIISLFFSWWYSRKIQISSTSFSWKDSLLASKDLIKLGLAFMYTGLAASVAAFLTRIFIVHEIGLNGAGLYQAIWAISGMFASFILNAMGQDFYPQLTSLVENPEEACKLVNEQTEIGILLAMPGLVATVVFAPFILNLLYSDAFVPGATLLPWFVVGILGRIISWPMGYIQMAKSATKWMYFSQTLSNTLLIIFTYCLLKLFGLLGVALAFALLYTIHTSIIHRIANRLIGFQWSKSTIKIILNSILLITTAITTQFLISGYLTLLIDFTLTGIAAALGLRGITLRLGPAHRLVRITQKIPLVRIICRSAVR